MPPDAALPLLGPYSPNERFGITQQMPAVMNKKFKMPNIFQQGGKISKS
jgi:hypothetical protein